MRKAMVFAMVQQHVASEEQAAVSAAVPPKPQHVASKPLLLPPSLPVCACTSKILSESDILGPVKPLNWAFCAKPYPYNVAPNLLHHTPRSQQTAF